MGTKSTGMAGNIKVKRFFFRISYLPAGALDAPDFIAFQRVPGLKRACIPPEVK
jgi:hypothetical protein